MGISSDFFMCKHWTNLIRNFALIIAKLVVVAVFVFVSKRVYVCALWCLCLVSVLWCLYACVYVLLRVLKTVLCTCCDVCCVCVWSSACGTEWTDKWTLKKGGQWKKETYFDSGQCRTVKKVEQWNKETYFDSGQCRTVKKVEQWNKETYFDSGQWKKMDSEERTELFVISDECMHF